MAFNYQSTQDQDDYDDLFYPLFLNIRNKPVVVIGGGPVAERKILRLIEYSAQVKVISPDVTEAIDLMADSGIIELEKREYQKGDVSECYLAISACGVDSVDKEVYHEADSKFIPVNVVDVPKLCTFTVPSVVRRDPLQIAISTGGNSPSYAKKLRKHLEEEIDPIYGPYVMFLGQVRDLVKSRVSGPEKIRKELLHDLVESDLFERYCAGEHMAVDEVFDEYIKPNISKYKEQ